MKRGKKTYIAFCLLHSGEQGELKLTAQQIRNEILNILLLLFGQYSHLRLSKEFNILYYNSTTNYGIIQVNNDFYQEILSCVVVLSSISKYNVKLDVVHTGRTLRSCKKVIVDDYLRSLEGCVVHERIYGGEAASLDSAIESLKSVSLIPH